jgi:nifR3 family TIM-barrel protein
MTTLRLAPFLVPFMPKPLTIGSLVLPNNLLLAPMAGVTNLPLRLLCREQGASLCFTEMVSVNGLVRDGKKTEALMRSVAEDRPLGVQLFGDSPELLAEGARRATEYGDLIDINMGCPVKKVVGTGAGSALLREPAKVADIIRAVRRATTLPFTVKIRSGWACGADNFLEIGQIAASEGCDAITLHPRSRAQMFDGSAAWEKIGELKASVPIPVIASGDLFTATDVAAVLRQSGCDAVMIARGALGNPWIFRQSIELLGGAEPRQPSMTERLVVAERHFALFCADAGERVAVREMRKHFSWYAKGVTGAAQFRAQVNQIPDGEGMLAAVRGFFGGERDDG